MFDFGSLLMANPRRCHTLKFSGRKWVFKMYSLRDKYIRGTGNEACTHNEISNAGHSMESLEMAPNLNRDRVDQEPAVPFV